MLRRKLQFISKSLQIKYSIYKLRDPEKLNMINLHYKQFDRKLSLNEFLTIF